MYSTCMLSTYILNRYKVLREREKKQIFIESKKNLWTTNLLKTNPDIVKFLRSIELFEFQKFSEKFITLCCFQI